MAKGQLRSTREAKKPKQPNKPAMKPSTSTVTPLRASEPTAAKKK